MDKRSYQLVNCRLIPLLDLYLNDEYKYVIGVTGSTNLLRIFLAIAFVILLIACINFTNLATARSELRAREIGMRKVSGATRRQLVTQFLGESLVCSFLALLLAAVLFRVFLSVFRLCSGRNCPSIFSATGKL